MTTDHFRYDLLAQDALRGVVRHVLSDVAKNGLPGEHHFYVSFRTNHPGVRLSQRLREQYPEEMTIVLQHQFWDLGVNETAMEVGLSFGGIPERLLVPLEAMTGFFDPSVQFGLRFEAADDIANDADMAANEDQREAEIVKAPTKSRKKPKGAASEPDQVKSDSTEQAENTSAEIVSLDRFRKKKDD